MPSPTRMMEAKRKPGYDFQSQEVADPKPNGKTIQALRKAAGNKKVKDT